jgi:hypothetical protein
LLAGLSCSIGLLVGLVVGFCAGRTATPLGQSQAVTTPVSKTSDTEEDWRSKLEYAQKLAKDNQQMVHPISIQIIRWSWARRLSVPDGVYKPAAGRVYLIVRIKVTSKSDERKQFEGSSIVIKASDRNVYTGKSFSDSDGLGLLDCDLLLGGSATGNVYFEVPPGTRPVSAHYFLELDPALQ